MAYTALEQMRRQNRTRFHKDTGPYPPALFQDPSHPADLKSSALRFLHERCEGLLFSRQIEAEEQALGQFRGTSLSPGQIPYNMEQDLNRLCLEKSLEAFLDSGVAEDAYTVYYCYLEIFWGRYANSRRMVELLSEFEANGSSLLMKHRDHYSHSVYVFALGLAVYETNSRYRAIFRAHCCPKAESEAEAAACFLEFWGLTSLFHDIGYPFELPFEQVLSYFEVEHQERGKGSIYLAYHSAEALTALDEAAQAHFERLYGRRFASMNELLAFDITSRLGEAYGFTESYLLDVLNAKPTEPDRFGYFMDHAFFSAALLLKEMREELGPDSLSVLHVEALSAILLHNSLYKFSISFYKDKDKAKAPLDPQLHPLAWLLMLCDELQCWDRTAYGRNSRTELNPMAADFDFSGEALQAVYYYDAEEQEKIDAFKAQYRAWEEGGEAGKAPRLKSYSDMAEKEQRFTADILKIIDTSLIPLRIRPDVRPADHHSKHTYLSGSNFLHLYDFAVALHGRNKPEGTPTHEIEERFAAQSLEYQLSGINRAKSFGRYLNEMDCFYTDRPVDYEMVRAFTPQQAAVLAPFEHERWIREHQAMGWRRGNEYETLPLEPGLTREALREQLRVHKLAMDGDPSPEEIREHYLSLSEEDQGKDWKPFNNMLKLLLQYDGLRIYRLR